MKIHVLKHTLLVAFAATLTSSCYPGGPEFVEDYDAVFTFKNDPQHDFSDPSIQTFYLPDTVMVLTDPNTSSSNITVNKSLILNRVRTNMLNAGYTEIVDSTVADYLCLVSVTRSDNYFVTWWWGWGPWWGFPPSSTTTNIRTGALIVELMDVKDLATKPQYAPIVWYGMAQGLFQGSSQNINNRITRSIDQMFTQSPYLNR
jgi:hypothetical protein